MSSEIDGLTFQECLNEDKPSYYVYDSEDRCVGFVTCSNVTQLKHIAEVINRDLGEHK